MFPFGFVSPYRYDQHWQGLTSIRAWVKFYIREWFPYHKIPHYCSVKVIFLNTLLSWKDSRYLIINLLWQPLYIQSVIVDCLHLIEWDIWKNIRTNNSPINVHFQIKLELSWLERKLWKMADSCWKKQQVL